jgi:protein-glutamine gamma-glutamyltransferase
MSIGRAGAGAAGAADRLDRAEAAAGAEAIERAAADGKITIADLKKVERELSRKFGAEKARAILGRALGKDPAKIDFDALDYLQGRVGSMEGHIARYQKVLVEHLAGAKLLDANFNGKLDADDLIFTKDAHGKVDVTRIGKALRDRVLIGSAMVDAAYAMAKAGHEFGDLEANPKFWKTSGGSMGVMKLKPGVRPSEALRDIFAHPDKYRFECATALVALRYKAILELIGEKDFDRICGDLKIGPWQQENDAARVWKIEGRGEKADVEATERDKKKIKPGDYTYFKNWDVSKKGFDEGWQGENVIYLGGGKYYGHPFGITTGEEIVRYLNENRKAGSKRSASLLDLRARLDPSVLKYDKDPNG